MTKQAPNDPQFIAPDAYPQMMGKQDGARAMQTLRSSQTQAKAQLAMEAAMPPMRAAILQYVDELEAAGADLKRVFTLGHEIRGFAATAGLVTTGRISEILCHYMDDMERLKKPADATIVALHVAAIARAARADEDDVEVGKLVAAELASLVAKRVAEAAGR
jgi:hypothetical protein